MFRTFYVLFILSLLSVSSLFSAPIIEFDTKTYDCGIVDEGKVEKLNATFVVTNTGDSVLCLESVRPGCGCTMVKFDTLVQPGKSVKIKSEVNIKRYRPGLLSKKIIVTSNAENELTVRLTIRAKVRAIVGTSVNFIDLTVGDSAELKTIYLTSMKKGLKVQEVLFKTDEEIGAAVWDNKKEIKIKFNFVSVDSIVDNRSHLFRLDLYHPNFDKEMSGEFIMKTNHNEMKRIILHGKIDR